MSIDKPNILFVTLDQFRADLLHGALAEVTPTPNIDRLTARGVCFVNHVTATVPCGPARASLLTGLYAMNHRAIRNGTPLARHHATIATEARKAGYEPLLFGYTDQTPDPSTIDPEDPDLLTYEGVAPGFREITEMRFEDPVEWPAYLKSKGYPIQTDDSGAVFNLEKPVTPAGQAPSVSDPAFYAAKDSDTAYLTDRVIDGLELRRTRPWFAHVAYIRPHPPFIAPAPWNTIVSPGDVPAPTLDAPQHPFLEAWFAEPSAHGMFWAFDGDCANLDAETIKAVRAVYCGMVAEVDHHIGRLIDWLDATGQGENTLIVLTADHGEMLGDKRMWGKQSVFAPAFHIPLIIVDPDAGTTRGTIVEAPTESVDVTPTILARVGLTPPQAMDGQSLLPWLGGANPPWRTDQMMEADFADPRAPTRFQRCFDLGIDACNAAILRNAHWSYVHFGGDVPPMLFNLIDDPQETVSRAADPDCQSIRMVMAEQLLRRMRARFDRRLTHLHFG
jgi:arylsulfatase A-like enzyme